MSLALLSTTQPNTNQFGRQLGESDHGIQFQQSCTSPNLTIGLLAVLTAVIILSVYKLGWCAHRRKELYDNRCIHNQEWLEQLRSDIFAEVVETLSTTSEAELQSLHTQTNSIDLENTGTNTDFCRHWKPLVDTKQSQTEKILYAAKQQGFTNILHHVGILHRAFFNSTPKPTLRTQFYHIITSREQPNKIHINSDCRQLHPNKTIGHATTLDICKTCTSGVFSAEQVGPYLCAITAEEV